LSKIYFLKGLPASGKSTWADEKVKSGQGKVKRVNKDLLREMLDFGKHSKDNEKFVKQVRDMIVQHALDKEVDIIVDDTNLADNHFNRMMEIAEVNQTSVQVIDFTDISVDECIKRDKKRQNYVGEKVIKRMYNQFIAKPLPIIENIDELPHAIISDIDGTLALHVDRSPFDMERCEEDIVNKTLYGMLQMFKHFSVHLVLVSGRSDNFREPTERWLKTHKISYDYLFMRSFGDYRSDDVIKREIYERHIHGKYRILAVFDDRIRVCRMWHQLGLPLFKVGDPEEDF
jgi:predicted kinase